MKLTAIQWRRWALSACLMCGLMSEATGQTPAPIYTKNTAFRLPVELDNSSRAEISSVKLFVKNPSGRWECVQTAPPTQTTFDYKVPADGEYAFTFVTVDKRGGSHPASVESTPPHRLVVVDTLAPEVTAQPVPLRGERHLQVLVRDLNTDWKSVQVNVQSGNGQWTPLQTYSAEMPNVFRVPNPSVFESRIRIAAADKAGNATIREIDLGDPTAALGAMARNNPRPDAPKPTDPPRTEAVDLTIPGLGNEKASTDIKLPDLAPQKLPEPVVPGQNTAVVRNNEIKIPDLPPVVPPGSTEMTAPSAKSLDERKEPGKLPLPVIRNPSDYNPKPDIRTAGDIQIPLPSNLIAPAANKVDAMKVTDTPKDIVSAPEPKPLPEQLATAKPPTSHPIVNSPTVVINYQLDSLGRMPQRIDFWASKDNNRNWVMIRDENGGVPPAKLTLPGDGVYSIRIRPGAGSKPPEPGEDPDCVVEVDTRKPDVSLLQPVLGTGGDDGTMLITWTAADRNLISNSISLFYATKPDGPWEVIVTGYKNEGAYRWAIPTGLSGSVYLRVEATDRANNIGRHDLAQPVALDSGKQRVKVIGITSGK